MMRGLTAAEILEFAESPLPQKPGFSSAPGFASASSVGRIDSALLELRAATFGPVLPCVTDCPACGEALEFDAPAAALIAPAPEERPTYRWAGDGAEVEYRLPANDDLAAIGALAGPGSAAAALFGRLVLSTAVSGQPLPASELPPEVVEAVAADMARNDPQAETVFDLNCPACAHAWVAPFDIESFFQAELAAESRRLLGEVHVLAHAYGWSEAEILALSPGRRRAYIELVLG